MKRWVCRLIFIGMPIVLLPERTLARWNHHDAAALNQATGLGTEYYNDLLSYRDPLFWEQIWEKSNLAFRSSAGSLNKKDFFFHQNIRITSSAHDPWQLAYSSERNEEPRRVLDNSALELSYGSEQNRWRLGLLGDGQTEKAFADLGVRLKYSAGEGSQWQLIGWSVDTFYTEKKHQREDYRTRAPWAWELLILQTWGASTVRLHHEQNQPVVWYQVSKDQRYDYRDQASELTWTYDVSETQQMFLQLGQNQEREAVAALTRMDSRGYQDLRLSAEIGQRLQKGHETFSYSFWGLQGRTREHPANEEPALRRTGTRQEAAFLWNWSKPFLNEIHDQHWGLVVNQVKLDERKREQATEVKIIWGPDFVLGEHGRIRFTTTWDVDQLVHDFPYTKKGFHPWGGGAASFLMIF